MKQSLNQQPNNARAMRHPLCWLLLLMAISAASEAGHADLYFSAPYSGQKVTEYEVNLPISRHIKKPFRIPADCAAAQAAFRQGAQQWCNRVERTIWSKVQQDCDYVNFLYRFNGPPTHDFVSGYDFMNAKLHDLPIQVDCNPESDSGNCRPLPPGVPDLTRILTRVEPSSEKPANDLQACRIKNGLFRGRIDFKSTGLDCETDPLATGFRVIAIDYADVNGDGYQDVTLRLLPLGRGGRRGPLILPLTRKQADGPFTIPQNLPGPVPRP
ncbi:hypothetical protein [endosymbiont of Riftia pachyptila]|nr:hypothetical protein [endosymbiont of Riftia pachyptila]EGV50864.1 hypothetical protein Rifp1Sym_cg00180 [endosymbiont of Riftia pachyptila (vent Ph05)]